MRNRRYLLQVYDPREVLCDKGTCVATLELSDQVRSRLRRCLKAFGSAHAVVRDLAHIAVHDSTLKWAKQVVRDDPVIDTALIKLEKELVLEDDTIKLVGEPLELEEVDPVEVLVARHGVMWRGYWNGTAVETAAVLTWEELLEDKPIEPH